MSDTETPIGLPDESPSEEILRKRLRVLLLQRAYGSLEYNDLSNAFLFVNAYQALCKKP